MDLPFNSIAFFIFLASILALFKEWKRSNAAQKLPPSPWKLPFIGNMHHLIGSQPHHAMRKLAKKYGDLMHLQLCELSAVVVSSPRLAKEIMKTHDLAFADRAQFLANKIFVYDCVDVACAPYGEYWRQMRKVCTLELLSAKTVQSFSFIRQDEALHLISSIKAMAASGQPINIVEKMALYTSSMISRAAFGNGSKDDKNTFLQIMKESLPLSAGLDISDLFPSLKILHPFSVVKAKLLKVHRKVDKILDKIIDQHVDNLERKKMTTGESGHEDIIDVLLRVKENGDLQIPISRTNMKAVLIDMFTAGSEPSSTTVEWAMAEMMRSPDVMAKAQRQIREAFNGKKEIEETDLQGLKYLKLVIKETLRLHPPAPLLVPRECREQCEIDGYIIPAKTRVMINAWAIGRDSEYWDDPENFKPERFEKCSYDFKGNDYEYLPFGAGRRMCPGISFGLANIELPLALLLYHFNWNLPNGLNSNDIDMTEIVGVTSSKKVNLCLLATLYDPSLDMAYQTV